jgi:hypothetical protein
MATPRWFALAVMQLTAMAFASAWEICEYASDVLIGTQPHVSGTWPTGAHDIDGRQASLERVHIVGAT